MKPFASLLWRYECEGYVQVHPLVVWFSLHYRTCTLDSHRHRIRLVVNSLLINLQHLQPRFDQNNLPQAKQKMADRTDNGTLIRVEDAIRYRLRSSILLSYVFALVGSCQTDLSADGRFVGSVLFLFGFR